MIIVLFQYFIEDWNEQTADAEPRTDEGSAAIITPRMNLRRVDDRQVISGIIYVIRNGQQ